MAKRPTVEVDEEYLLEVMAGGKVRPRKEVSGEQSEPVVPVQPPTIITKTAQQVQDEPEDPAEQGKTIKPVRKKREIPDYEVVFLQRRASVPRRQTYISSELYDKINSFLPVLTRGLSITAYIDNILLHHLEQYRDDINEMYESKSRKPL
jgi:hypothetical protein